MKKLKKSFVISRVCELPVLPLSWQIKKVLELSYFLLDLRLCKLVDLKKQISHLFEVGNFSASNILGVSIQHGQHEDGRMILPNPELILKIDLSLNDIIHIKVSDMLPFPELRFLDASFNCIDNFSGIVACPHLTDLCLAYNNIKNLPTNALEQCKHLHYMDLSSNRIDDVSQLPLLPNLTTLHLRHNNLTNLDGLHVLPVLHQLHVQNNKIMSIVGISACTQLRCVNLSNNRIDKACNVIQVFKHLRSMVQLDMKGNPVAEMVDLKTIVGDDTTISILDNLHAGSLKQKFAELTMLDPPTYDQPLQTKLKDAVVEAMEENLKIRQEKHNVNLNYFHSKIMSLIMEMEDYKNKIETDKQTWCSYIDTLSVEEAQALSADRIRSLTHQSGFDGPLSFQVDGDVHKTRKQISKQHATTTSHDAASVLQAAALALSNQAD